MRATRMFELSPFVTAARASASLDARFLEAVAVEPDPDDRPAVEVVAEAPEGLLLAVDDRGGVPGGLDRSGQTRSDAAASDHDHVHGRGR